MKLATDELVDFIKERHRRTVVGLKSPPALAIAVAGNAAASASFIRAKQRYASDIGASVVVEHFDIDKAMIEQIKAWGSNNTIKGIVVQLPLPTGFEQKSAIAAIKPSKDVDGLTGHSPFEPATAKGILWLLNSLPLNLKSAVVVVVGQGKLVGRPVSDLLEASGVKVNRLDETSHNLAKQLCMADLIISGVGHPGLITRPMLKKTALVIDAGTAEAGGQLAGDADPALYDDPDIKVTPVPGGVGPVG